jgi:hypothetical protein
MNAKPVRQFVQVPLVHYSTLATSADDLANNMSAMLSAIESPKSVSKTEWEKLKADSQKSVAAVKAEVEEGEIPTFLLEYCTAFMQLSDWLKLCVLL